MRNRTTCTALLASFVLLLAAESAHAAFKVIVHSSSQMASVSRDTLQAVFLKKTTRWSDGTAADPIDLDSRSAVRQEFSGEVLGRDVAAIKSYWLHMIFSGRDNPPMEAASESKVIEHVARTPGAVGYVSAATPLSPGVKVIEVSK